MSYFACTRCGYFDGYPRIRIFLSSLLHHSLYTIVPKIFFFWFFLSSWTFFSADSLILTFLCIETTIVGLVSVLNSNKPLVIAIPIIICHNWFPPISTWDFVSS
ncbi:hypothetical protein Lalb_Chr02g0156731 [Lupinus albus]|uniref:Uncharacterized protein n=1 Tax=Lupinus albus TaxID=3870 RepID=A0A6A4R300_LUPAL|nr:hypothetical protein Lalb_Chr02g0156731 [Lupinus albus]